MQGAGISAAEPHLEPDIFTERAVCYCKDSTRDCKPNSSTFKHLILCWDSFKNLIRVERNHLLLIPVSGQTGSL